ncbi:MAG: cupin domain-containing protein [Steroidobacteraceae bacterium]
MKDDEADVLRPDECKSYERGGGTRTTPLVSRALGAEHFITGITEIAAGAAVPLHSHNCEESVVLLEGEGIVETAAGEHRLRPFDSTFIRAGLVHRFRNPGTSAMRILWIYGSSNATRTLQDSGETRRITAEHGG